jgi:hypothetical protein
MKSPTKGQSLTVSFIITMRNLHIINFDKITLSYTPYYGVELGKLWVEWL